MTQVKKEVIDRNVEDKLADRHIYTYTSHNGRKFSD